MVALNSSSLKEEGISPWSKRYLVIDMGVHLQGPKGKQWCRMYVVLCKLVNLHITIVTLAKTILALFSPDGVDLMSAIVT